MVLVRGYPRVPPPHRMPPDRPARLSGQETGRRGRFHPLHPTRPSAITRGPDSMRFARFLTLALLSAAIVAGCADASAGWTYLPAPSTTPAPSALGRSRAAPTGNPNVVEISALNVKFEQTTVDGAGRHAVPGPVREQGRGHAAQRRAPPGRCERRRAVQGRGLQRRCDACLRRPGPRRRGLRLRLHRPSHDDRDAHRRVIG